jgi:hypothetical protein
MGKRKNWDSQEELNLAKAWKETSKDPIKGTDQQGGDLLGKYFQENVRPGCRSLFNEMVQTAKECAEVHQLLYSSYSLGRFRGR